MAMVVSLWCRTVRVTRQDLKATLISLCSFQVVLLVVYSCVGISFSWIHCPWVLSPAAFYDILFNLTSDHSAAF